MAGLVKLVKRAAWLFWLGTLSGCFFYAGSYRVGFSTPAVHLRLAEDAKENKDYDTAIAEYKKHIEWRLGDVNRPKKENPYFYYIFIGDIYLKTDRVEKALKAYLTAKNEGLAQAFIVDRLRLVAAWYEKRKRFEEGMALLAKYRELDPLLFDVDIDRLHHKFIRHEQSQDKFEQD